MARRIGDPRDVPGSVNEVLTAFAEWRSKRNSGQLIGQSENIDKDTVYLGDKIDKLTDVINLISLIENNSGTNEIGMVKLRNLSRSEVDDAKESDGRFLGSGAFGEVYKGKLGGQDVVVKEFMDPKQTNKTADDAMSFKRYINAFIKEILPMHCYPAENIIQLLAYSYDEKNQHNPSLIFPYMENGSLYDNLCTEDNIAPLTWRQRANIALGIARGLTHLHYVEITHGDIKSTNILLDKHFEPKIGDFGTVAFLARSNDNKIDVLTHDTMDDIRGSPNYLPYDYLVSGQIRKEVDVFSFGILLFELMSGKNPGHVVNKKTGENFRSIINKFTQARVPSEWFDSRNGPFKQFKYPLKDGRNTLTTWPFQLFRIGNLCAKDRYKERKTMSEVVIAFEKLIKMCDDDDKSNFAM